MEACISRIISRYIDATDEEGITPMHIAAAMGHPKWLKKLIETGGVDVTDRYGFTALQLAACCGHTEAVKILLHTFGTRPVKVNAKNNIGNTALHLAAMNDHTNAHGA